ncbi:hypothetical protein D3C84_978550 [compost metagenome]
MIGHAEAHAEQIAQLDAPVTRSDRRNAQQQRLFTQVAPEVGVERIGLWHARHCRSDRMATMNEGAIAVLDPVHRVAFHHPRIAQPGEVDQRIAVHVRGHPQLIGLFFTVIGGQYPATR